MTDERGRAASATEPSVTAPPRRPPASHDAPAPDDGPGRPSASPHAGTATGTGAAPDPGSAPDADRDQSTPALPPRGRRTRRVLTAVLVVLLLALATGAVVLARHLWLTAEAWEDRADTYLDEAQEIGTELAATRGDLEGTRSELEAVRAQLATAQARIVELADEKAQLGDDREVQRQLVDYQERVSEAGGRVALALDQCVQGQQQLIGYLEAQVTGTAAYDPQELTAFREDVEALCQAASEANISLQRELSR